MNKVLRNPYAYLVFVVPALVLYLTFYVVPLFQSLRYSFTSWNGINEPVFNGLENFQKAFDDPKFWIGFWNNLYFVCFSLFIQVPIIIFVGIVVSYVRRMLDFYKVSVFMPSILSTASVGVIWQFIYKPDAGLLNQLLKAVGLSEWAKPWLGDPNTAMTSLLVANAWQWTGFYVVLILAAIFAIPSEVLEAAEIDGAVGFKKAWMITVPLIRPVIIVIMLLSITGAMKALDIVLIMTNGGPFGKSEVMGTYMYKQAYSFGDFGYANAISIIIFLFTAVITLIFNLLTRDKKEGGN
ncbi:raffinose/stachyose/melibiose transport system permease protein [Paenibacillus sp. UNCCL117]|uniref:carbohydrate ABC transporter permease n=1 Tax=unclassified Paenibacillus TaxID=185978 RepID=UPI00088E20ED|nr:MULTISPECIES: sugar ABC transporter permease [unclassified Paenibacillus]SDE54096.1 raffinose/stachyose/melibiose transport system permease protein [Paenibacillus sp. cl123]SFW68136.1 raffinose/stachyose/melibiose transport system permease protein [Paenibacillus sp. UNCCL117]